MRTLAVVATQARVDMETQRTPQERAASYRREAELARKKALTLTDVERARDHAGGGKDARFPGRDRGQGVEARPRKTKLPEAACRKGPLCCNRGARDPGAGRRFSCRRSSTALAAPVVAGIAVEQLQRCGLTTTSVPWSPRGG